MPKFATNMRKRTVIGLILALAMMAGTIGASAQTIDTLADSIVTDTLNLAEDFLPTVGGDSVLNLNQPVDSFIPRTLYDFPYSATRQLRDTKRLIYNTVTFVGAGLVTLAVLETLPEGATAWNKTKLRSMGFWRRWTYHVERGPVWDKDNAVFNYILHPYGGAVYYMSARSCGFNILGSFLYSFGVSTVLWEYGIEAFMEIPSLQDIIITPIAGMAIGECFYRVKRAIVRNGYHLAGSWFLGHLVAWLVDPINEFVSLFAGNPCKSCRVQMSPVIAGRGTRIGVSLSLTI